MVQPTATLPTGEPRCQAVKEKDNKQCSRKAQEGQAYCWQHGSGGQSPKGKR